MTQNKISRREFARSSAGTVLLNAAAVASHKLISTTAIGADTSAALGDGSASIVRSDFSEAEPAEALTRNFQKDRWQLVDYETANGIKGVMAWARPEDNCPTLTLRLNAVGPRKIFLGINYTNSY